jgi:hypothetical protein
MSYLAKDDIIEYLSKINELKDKNKKLISELNMIKQHIGLQ